MNFSQKLISLLTLFTLAACGPSSDLYSVRLMTGLENLAPAKDLMEGLTHQMVAVAPVCSQPNLYAGLKTGSGKMDLIANPVGMIVSNTNSGTIDSTWLTNNSNFQPIRFKVPAGIQEFGVIGSLIEPVTGNIDADGSCTAITSIAAGGAVKSSYSMLGHKKINISGNTDVPLNVWMTSTTVAPSTISSVPGTNCINSNASTGSSNGSEDVLTQICPNRNFKTLMCLNDTNTNCFGDIKLEYLLSQNANHVVHYLNFQTALTTPRYVPDIDPMVVTPISAGEIAGTGTTFADNNNGNNGMIVSQKSVPNGFVALFHDGSFPAIIAQRTTITNPQLKWVRPAGVTAVDLYLASGFLNTTTTTNGFTTPYATNVTPLTSSVTLSGATVVNGGSYTIGITAAGSTSILALLYYRPVDTLMASPTYSTPGIGSGVITVTTNVTGGTHPPVGADYAELILYTVAGDWWVSPRFPISIDSYSGSDNFTFTGVPSQLYNSGELRVSNDYGGVSYTVLSGNVNP